MKTIIALLAVLLLLGGCQSKPAKDGTAIDKIKQVMREGEQDAQQRRPTPPPEVSASLLPPMQIQLGAGPKEAEKRFDVSVVEAPAR